MWMTATSTAMTSCSGDAIDGNGPQSQAFRDQPLGRAAEAARSPARPDAKRHPGHQGGRPAAGGEPARVAALVPAPGDQRYVPLDAAVLPAGDPARQPLRPAEIPGWAGDDDHR